MSTTIANYDGSVVTVPQELVRPESVEELQSVMRETDRYPGPVRAMGSFHSLTPCASTSGTVVSMLGMNRILKIDAEKMTLTAEAGVKMIEAAVVLREQNLQFRADAFNVLNHPTLGTPNGSMNANGGLISGPKFFQNNTPDARFFQLSLKYAF